MNHENVIKVRVVTRIDESGKINSLYYFLKTSRVPIKSVNFAFKVITCVGVLYFI